MSVSSEYGLSCPRCGHDNRLDITALINVRLTADGTDPDDAADTSHEWDQDSTCQCIQCGFRAKVRDFSIPESSLPLIAQTKLQLESPSNHQKVTGILVETLPHIHSKQKGKITLSENQEQEWQIELLSDTPKGVETQFQSLEHLSRVWTISNLVTTNHSASEQPHDASQRIITIELSTRQLPSHIPFGEGGRQHIFPGDMYLRCKLLMQKQLQHLSPAPILEKGSPFMVNGSTRDTIKFQWTIFLQSHGQFSTTDDFIKLFDEKFIPSIETMNPTFTYDISK